MATTKQGGARKRPSSSTGKSAAARKSSSTSRSSNGSRNGSTRTSPAKRRPAAKRAASKRTTTTSSNSNRNGVPATVMQVANRAKRPAVAVGAAAAGLAGGLVIRSRTRRRTVLGVPVPRSLGKTVSGWDAKSMAKSVGQASKQFAKTTKTVSKDLERAGDQAERIGKILD